MNMFDEDFVLSLRQTLEYINEMILGAESANDENQLRYLNGMKRGVRMALETYDICIQERAIRGKEFEFKMAPNVTNLNT